MKWNSLVDANIDTRLFFANTIEDDDWNECRWNPNDKNILSIYINSGVTGMPICYTTEALKYAQTGYMVSIMCTQWAVYIICKTRRLSISTQMSNNYVSLIFSTAIVLILVYNPLFNEVLGTRQLPFAHFAIPSLSFFSIIFFYDELRKTLLRNGIRRN